MQLLPPAADLGWATQLAAGRNAGVVYRERVTDDRLRRFSLR
jgi:hypothetical protein